MGVEFQIGVAVDALVRVKGCCNAEICKNLTHRSSEKTDLTRLWRKGEVLNAPSTRGGVLDELTNSGSAAEVFREIHGEHVACSIIGNALVPPTHRLFGSTRPGVDVPGQRGIRSKAEVDGDIGVSFIDPEVLIGVESIVQQVFQFVSEDGTPPRERDVSKVNENRFSGRRKGGGEVTAGVVGAVDIVDDDLDLTIVVNVGRCEATAVLVILAVVGGHGGVDG